MQIPLQEIEFLSSSTDPGGRTFRWKHDVYRGIAAEHAEFYKKLLERSVIKRLINEGSLIDTEASDLTLEGYQFVLKHRSLPVVSSPYEWCFQAFKDAAILVLDIQQALMREGLALYDPHPWNILFDGCRPVYIDFCSIKQIDESKGWAAEFEDFLAFLDLFSNPLLLMAEGQGRIIRFCLQGFALDLLNVDSAPPGETPVNLLKRKLKNFLLPRVGVRFVEMLRSFLKLKRIIVRNTLDPGLVRLLASRVKALEMPKMHTQWSDYYDKFPGFSPSDEWNAKQHNVHEVLLRLRPRSVLDIGCNCGWYSQLAASLGSAVIAVDYDEICVDHLYKQAKATNARINTVVMDLLKPSADLSSYLRAFAPAPQRFKSDMVLALAIVHHLAFGRGYDFERIAATLDAFVRKYLVVEFVPTGANERDSESEIHTWYTIENFEKALGRYYRTVERRPSDPNSRILLICEK